MVLGGVMQLQEAFKNFLHILIKDRFKHTRLVDKLNKSSNLIKNSFVLLIFAFILVHTCPKGIDKRKIEKMRNTTHGES
jgi:hypothetical protein